MRKSLTLLFIGIISIGLFCFSKKAKNTEVNTNSVILGMVLLKEADSLNIDGIINELKTKWKLDVKNVDAADGMAVFTIEDYKIAIANIPAAIPEGEVERAAEYNYLWKNGVKETSKHKGHIILSIMNAGKKPVQENLLYSKLASAVMNNSNSMGIYIGNRTLVIEKKFYQANVEEMSEQNLPLNNWIYFGLVRQNGKHSVYTYGLADFGKKEMEIVDSDQPLETLNEMMLNLTHYVLSYDVNLNAGETVGMSEEQKLKISESKGRFLDGTTLKIKY